MERKALSGIILTLLLTGTLTLAFNIQPVKASGTIYIRADGSIDPPDAPIITLDNVTYTLTDNITSSGDGIVVERDNIVVDGAGYTVQGPAARFFKGIDVSGRSNVTIKKTNIKDSEYGVFLDSASGNTVSRNNVTNNRYGVFLRDSSYNIIFGNNMTVNGYYGIFLSNSSYNCISENEIIRNIDAGIFLTIHSSYNIVSGNHITSEGGTIEYPSKGSGVLIWQYSNSNSFVGNVVENCWGIELSLSLSNYIYDNSFINNTVQVSIRNSTNLWDNGFEGNYWSDYNGKDTDGDGIGDTPYIIDENNQDNYPLMNSPNPQEQMRILYYDLLRKFNELLVNHNNLKANYNNLNATYDELESLQETTMGELNHVRNLMYIFITTTLVLLFLVLLLLYLKRVTGTVNR